MLAAAVITERRPLASQSESDQKWLLLAADMPHTRDFVTAQVVAAGTFLVSLASAQRGPGGAWFSAPVTPRGFC